MDEGHSRHDGALVKNRAITATQPLYAALSDTHQCNYHSLALDSNDPK